MNLELDGGTISIGQEGFPAYLMLFILFISGPLAWFTPAATPLLRAGRRASSRSTRCIGVNLGGFFVGMLLGVIGGGLIFAWNPDGGPTA